MNYLKYFLLAIAIFCLNSFGFYQANDSNQYSFNGQFISEKEAYLQFTYKNESTDTQCIRAEDLSFKLLGDAMYVRSSTGEPMKYVGPKGRGPSMAPQDFIILPPGKETTSSIRLTDFYKLKKSDVNVSYSIPIIPCKYVLEKYISLPPPVFMKDKINDPTVEKTDVYATDYPEWSQYGFIAISKPLHIERSKK